MEASLDLGWLPYLYLNLEASALFSPFRNDFSNSLPFLQKELDTIDEKAYHRHSWEPNPSWPLGSAH